MESLLKFYFWYTATLAVLNLLILGLGTFPKSYERTVGGQAFSTIVAITLAIITGFVLYS